MFDFIKDQWVGIIALVVVVFALWFGFSGQETEVPAQVDLGAVTSVTKFTNPISFVEGITVGGDACTLTDANGGAYALTDAQTADCSYLTFAAGGAGQAVIALSLPATSTMTRTIPSAGDCKTLTYSAQNLPAATTTTITAGTGHNLLAYTANDDVIDGLERAEIKMCRLSSGNVDTFTTEILNAD